MVKVDVVVIVVKQLVNLSTRLLTIFIVFSYRRLLDVICADRHWKLVYIWISAHITMLEEHPPISGSFLFFSIRDIRAIRGRYKLNIQNRNKGFIGFTGFIQSKKKSCSCCLFCLQRILPHKKADNKAYCPVVRPL